MNIFKRLYCRIFQLGFKAALPILPYREPTILDKLSDIADLLKENGIVTAFIVTDKGVRGAGIIDLGVKSLIKEGILYKIYDGTAANPTIDNVEQARKMYIDCGANAIIAIGGGSAMDCAKALGARIVKPKLSVNQMQGLLHIRKKLPLFIAVPTTAGTGSETTVAAVITDTAAKHKYPINDFSLIPHYAVLDPSVTMSMPKSITATTGMDALTHAVEAYIGKSTTQQTRAMSEEAVALISKYLKRAYDNPKDAEARKGMLRAAYCAGVAFTKSYVGYVHAVAHSLGGQYGVAHGLANAVILPYFLEEYGNACAKQLARLALAAGIANEAEATDVKATAEKFIEWVRQLNKSMNIPSFISGIKEEDIPTLAKHADAEGNPLYPVPKLMDKDELAVMYKIIGNKGKEAGKSSASKPVAEKKLPAKQPAKKPSASKSGVNKQAAKKTAAKPAAKKAAPAKKNNNSKGLNK